MEMLRDILNDLKEWKKSSERKPLIVRGARQVGKSYIIRELGKSFQQFIEINFEESPSYKEFFEGDFDIRKLLLNIEVATNKKIIPNETLVFFDEIQNCPNAITALRYFYEKMPNLHIIVAGSLIEFSIENIGIPVGRVSSIYIYPMSFLEFLEALGEHSLSHLLKNHTIHHEIESKFHNKLLDYLKEYLIVGGMPEAVKSWVVSRDVSKVKIIHNDLIETYKQDFSKYAKKNQIKYLEKVFESIPTQLGHKFIFNHIDDSLKTRELRPALELLVKAQVAHMIYNSSGNGVPLGAEAEFSFFKIILIDVALTQTLLGLSTKDILLDFDNLFVNKGEIVEAFIGQELLAYSNPHHKHTLYFWQREKQGSRAEVDYLISKNQMIYPVEVKSGPTGHLKSMIQFLKEKKRDGQIGYHFSMQNFASTEKIKSIPLYAVAKIP